MSTYYGQPYYSLRDQYRMGPAAKKHRSGRSHRKFRPLPPEAFHGMLLALKPNTQVQVSVMLILHRILPETIYNRSTA